VVAAGTTVRVGQLVATIDDSAGAAALAPTVAHPPTGALAAGAAPVRFTPTLPAGRPDGPALGGTPIRLVLGEPEVRELASAEAPPLVPRAGMEQLRAKLGGATGADVPLSPAVRRLVHESGIDPGAVTATGPGGRIVKGDVLRLLDEQARATGSTAPSPSSNLASPPASSSLEPPSTPQVSGAPAPVVRPRAAGERETRRKMSTIRQRIAERMVAVQHQAAILTTFNEADLSHVMGLRERHREPFEQRHGVRLGMMSFFVKAVVDALHAVPALNARIDGDEIVEQHYFDIGVAVGTERGLIVPVLRDCDRLGFAAIEKAIADFAARARARTITLEELGGGCFTISNGGVYGSLLSTPILNPPQSGILGLHAVKKRPVVVGEQIVIRPMMYLAVSYDHRLVDGQEAVRFLKRVVDCIESPERLMLEV
jgi:2-oxoglutarate dehydrogenase E2 component (dihydrolipoamide succinyltransferase)